MSLTKNSRKDELDKELQKIEFNKEPQKGLVYQ